MAAVVITEAWTGADGAAWPSQWTTVQGFGSGGTVTIQGNAGHMTTGSANTHAWVHAWVTSMSAITDTDVTMDFWPDAGTQHSQLYLNLNATTVQGPPDDGYSLTIYWSTDGTIHYDVHRKTSSGTSTTIGAFAALTQHAAYKVRFQRSGSVVQFKVWSSTEAEPSSWTFSYTDASPLPAGKFSIAFQNSSDQLNCGVSLDNLTVTDSNAIGGTPGSADFSATGTLAASGVPAVNAPVAQSQPASLTTAATPHVNAPAALSAAGTLSSSLRSVSVDAAVSLSATGTLAASGAPTVSVPVALSASGRLQNTTLAGTADFASEGTLSAAGSPAFAIELVVFTEGVAVANGAPTLPGSGSTTETGTLQTVARPIPAPAISIGAEGFLQGRGPVALLITVWDGTTETEAHITGVWDGTTESPSIVDMWV